MPASVSGSKTCNNSPMPSLSAASLTTLMSTPLESLTVAELLSLADGLRRIGKGVAPTSTLGSIFI
jgi:hypothetical protein